MRTLTLARDLTRRKARDRDGMFVVEGIRAAEELVRSPLEVVGALAAPQLKENARGSAVRDALLARGTIVSDVTDREFGSAAETESPQGILIIARTPSRSLAQFSGRETLRLLILDAVQDPGNVGTLLRTSAALGADASVALPGTVDVWNAKVVRSAMGAHFHHDAFHVTWPDLHAFCQAEGVSIWGADAQGASVATLVAPPRLALAVGNEGAGLSATVRDAAPTLVSLPISDVVESLNVAVAAGILLFELRR